MGRAGERLRGFAFKNFRHWSGSFPGKGLKKAMSKKLVKKFSRAGGAVLGASALGELRALKPGFLARRARLAIRHKISRPDSKKSGQPAENFPGQIIFFCARRAGFLRL